jgi:3-keto-5-aminohexanoate cleavage enzyme
MSPKVTNRPLIIEAAISPLRWDLPAQTAEEMAKEGIACLDAGAGIVHHHHDMRLDAAQSATQIIAVGEQILTAHPNALIYTDYLKGRVAVDENAHLRPMSEAGVLRMFAIDPGITTFGSFDDNGVPTRTYTDGLKFSEAHGMVEFAKEQRVPMSLGVFEPGHLRWIVSYAERVGFPPGSIIKLYFGGEYMVDRPGTKGLNFGMPPTTAALDVFLSMMKGCDLPYIVSLFGGLLLESPLARYALEQGGHLRVGIEDAAGLTEMTNAELVEAAVKLADEVGRPVARSADALPTLMGA